MRSIARSAVVAGAVGLFVTACVETPGNSGTPDDTPVTVEKAFAGGTINLELSGGAYEVRGSTDAKVHVATSGHTGDTKVDVTTDGQTAKVSVSNTPRSNFHATIDVPKTSDVVVRLSAGEIKVDLIAGNLDVESTAGNVTIAVSDPKDYSSVTASVKAGDLKAEPFGGSKSGLMQDFSWSGSGKRTLRAKLGAGNLKIEQ